MALISLVLWFGVIFFILYILRKIFNGPKTPFSKDMTGKIVIVTGANSGIGKETAMDLLVKGAKVIFACRDEKKTNNVLNQIDEKLKERAIFMKLDVSDFNSILNFITEFKKRFKKLDVLVNNAGAIFDTFGKKNGIEISILTNHIGNVILSAGLLTSFNPEGLIVNVSSSFHLFVGSKQLFNTIHDYNFLKTEKAYRATAQYNFTKLANVVHAIHMDLYAKKNKINIKTASVHPGIVATEFNNNFNTFLYKLYAVSVLPFRYIFFKDMKMGAQTTLHVIYMEYKNINSGGYYSDCKEAKMNKIAKDIKNVENLMTYTKILIDNNFEKVPQELKEYLL